MKRILKIGLDSAAPFPMHSNYNSAVFEGFEVDLITHVATLLNLEIHYEVSLWKNILEKLYKGELDMICSAVTITASRQMILEFSKPYLQFQLCAIVKQGNILTDLKGFKNKKIGIRTATEAEKYVMAQFPGNLTSHAETNTELYDNLMADKIDVLIDDSPIAGGFLDKHKSLKIGFFLPETKSQYAMAMKKGDMKLKRQINDVLTLLKTNGTYDALYNKWFKHKKLLS